MINFSCYCCGNKSYTILADKNIIRFGCYGYDKYFLKCNNCDLVQLYPQWTEEELNSLYERYSKKKDFKGQIKKKEVRKWIRKYFPVNMSTPALEIGCGTGDTIKWLRSKGYYIKGIDKEKTLEDINNGIFGIELKEYVKQECELNCFNSFIFSFQVLEHTQPIEFLNDVLKILKNEYGPARFVFEIPNIEDPLFTVYKNKNFNKFFWYPYHLFCFSPKTISDILNQFPIRVKVIRKQRYGIVNHLRWLIKGKPGNFNLHIPFFDDIYKFFLTRVFKKSDTMVIIGTKK